MNCLYKRTQEKDKGEAKKINDKFDALKSALQARIDALDGCKPGSTSTPVTTFRPTQIYYSSNPDSVITPQVHQEKIKNFLFRDFIITTITDDR